MTDVNETSRIFREMCLKADIERDKGLTTPEDIGFAEAILRS